MNAHSPWAFDGPAFDTDFEIGDVVRIKSGGPKMTVISLCDCGTVEVAWGNEDGTIDTDVFPVTSLMDVDDSRLTLTLDVDTSAFKDALDALAADARRTMDGIYDDMRRRRVRG